MTRFLISLLILLTPGLGHQQQGEDRAYLAITHHNYHQQRGVDGLVMARRKNVRIPARVGLSGHDADASARGNIMIALMLIRTRGYGLKWLIQNIYHR